MKRIVVAVDGCPHSREIIDCAVSIAKSMPAKITIVHVIAETSVPAKYKDSHGDALPEHYYEDLLARSIGGMTDGIEEANVEYESVYGLGDPAKFVLETAKKIKPDFLVVGMHGLRHLSKVRAMGGSARGIIENSPVPVIVVPRSRFEGDRSHPSPLRS